MRSFDGTKMSELVGVLIHSRLSNINKNTDMGPYRDDGLIIIRNPNGRKVNSYRKRIPNALEFLGFEITIYTNLKIVNFLDVTLNLNLKERHIRNLFKKRERHTHLHRHVFKPPTSNIKQMPKWISRRLSDNSSKINIFNKYNHIYENALQNGSYK